MPSTHTISARQHALTALQNGQPLVAKQGFAALIQQGDNDLDNYLGLAYACHALGDNESGIMATDNILRQQPNHVRALLLKGDFIGDRDTRAAYAFYRNALMLAEQNPPKETNLRQHLSHALAKVNQYQQQFTKELLSDIDQITAQYPQSPKFNQSIDLLLGKKQIYYQQPSVYYFPELPQKQFYDASEFHWVKDLEANTSVIEQELRAYLSLDRGFSAYVQSQPDRPNNNKHQLLDNADWSACYLYRNGDIEADALRYFPQTLAVLAKVPFVTIQGRAPNVLFSRLAPGAKIPPHHGFVNTRLICHLPIIEPGNCGLRVGNDSRQWQWGQCWLFDDTIEHEAWNASQQERIILLFEVWKPELSESEQQQISAMFSAIGKNRDDWSL
ncbi:aspartyl/asparaginyl beta-hydroxylase domain-containing protein [Shewanella sp. NIFS-20-20]|uniref:aspartyl/asparaginyl beta-hydroxylase domain-containing protein n=1 Tax=Shewanella sp. NIFS-20-20 TaxID=2853806 RepID=UPI001C4637DA|nr:aspartyl/asparaginyl beta-hydroxylase domain-containing protein [Shewanella sp. NIFS-20-20]MBV7314631.1 aspartyl/asparaginyl beta-hydroxylase domain-containing protein [Shewanella sp. NIFS-20-20]